MCIYTHIFTYIVCMLHKICTSAKCVLRIAAWIAGTTTKVFLFRIQGFYY